MNKILLTDLNLNIYGCLHYSRHCEILAPCCNKYYSCRFCHNNDNTHILNRFNIEKIKCLKCNNIQNKSQYCNNCNTCFGNYFCNICNIFDNFGLEKNIYHCNKCGICRIGIKEYFYHCDICGGCLPLKLKDNHKCIFNSMKQECAICLNDIFNCRNSSLILKCGHMFHSKCINLCLLYKKSKCPLCRQNIEF